MSAYIVSKKELERVAELMAVAVTREHPVNHPLVRDGWITTDDEDLAKAQVKDFINKIIELNHLSMFARYDDPVDKNRFELIEKIPEGVSIFGNSERKELFNFLSTIEYQCCEGFASELKVYKTLQEIKWRLADKICLGWNDGGVDSI